MLMAAVALEALAVVLIVSAFASRTDPAHFDGQAGTIEDLLDEFSTPARPEFTSAGMAMLVLAAVAAIVGSVLLLRWFRRGTADVS